MRIFVLDAKGGRVWNMMVPDVCLVDEDGEPAPSPGDVLIFHEEDGPLRRLAETWATSGVRVVAVHLGGGDGSEPVGGYYRRRRAVGKPTDPHFKSCFGHFRRRLEETGRPDWALLEGPPAPDALLAYHLLGLLPNDADAVTARKGLLGAALEEGRVIAEANELAPPTDAEIRDHQYLRKLLLR